MLKQFYTKALPSSGTYCVTVIDRNKAIRNRFLDSKSDLFAAIDRYKAQGDTNIFIAPGTFGGHSRRADNSAFLRSFFIDLDTGVGKAYDDKQDALDALDWMLAETGLPPPVRIDSGGGIHAYWIFDEDISSSRWKVYAEKFKAKIASYIPIDPVVTADAARIMRCPETVNYKYEPPQLTSILDAEIHEYSFEAFVEFLGEETVGIEDLLSSVPKGLDEETKKLLKVDNLRTSFQLIAERSLMDEGCAQIKYILLNETTLDYNMWRSGLSIVRQCEDWETAIHDMSSGHPGYNRAATIAKAEDTFDKPHSCATFEGQRPGGCDGCPYRGNIKNPLAIGRVLKEPAAGNNSTAPVVEVFKFPEYLLPYRRGAQGGIYFTPPPETDADGKKIFLDPIMVYENDIYPVKRMYSQSEGEFLVMRAVLPHDPTREFPLPVRQIHAVDEFRKAMGTHGIVFPTSMAQHMMNYMNKWGKYMVNTASAEVMRMQNGWTENHDAFVVGLREITKNGEERPTAASPMIHNISKLLKPHGSYEKWQEAADKLNMPGFELHQFGMMTGFGSPLMPFTSTSGVTLCFSGKSGNAKTGALYAAVSIAGNPKELAAAGENQATDNALVAWYLALQNIVFGIDEASNKSPIALSNLIHRVSQGKGKWRMHSNVNAVRELEQSASGIAFITSNQYIGDKMTSLKSSPDGELARIAEFMVERPTPMIARPELGFEIFDTFRTNYGHAITPYIKYLFKIGEAKIKETIAKWNNTFLKDFGNDTTYRYYVNLVSATMAGAELASNAGIVRVDLSRMYTRVVREMMAVRDNAKINSPDYAGIIGEFMNKHQTGVLVINDTRVTREPRTALVARIDVKNGIYYVSKLEFKKYLAELQVSSREFKFAMTEAKSLVFEGKQRLSNGWAGVVSSPIAVYGFKVEIPPEFLSE